MTKSINTGVIFKGDYLHIQYIYEHGELIASRSNTHPLALMICDFIDSDANIDDIAKFCGKPVTEKYNLHDLWDVIEENQTKRLEAIPPYYDALAHTIHTKL